MVTRIEWLVLALALAPSAGCTLAGAAIGALSDRGGPSQVRDAATLEAGTDVTVYSHGVAVAGGEFVGVVDGEEPALVVRDRASPAVDVVPMELVSRIEEDDRTSSVESGALIGLAIDGAIGLAAMVALVVALATFELDFDDRVGP
jgi:hypothetical protein